MLAGLQIAVYDARFVRCLERLRDLPRARGERFLQWDRTLLQPVSERRPVDQFHDQVVRPDIKQRADIGMVQRGDHASLALEPFRELLRGNLHGDAPAQARILRAIDLAHPTRTKTVLDCVRPESVAGRDGHEFRSVYRRDCRVGRAIVLCGLPWMSLHRQRRRQKAIIRATLVRRSRLSNQDLRTG